eukprot:g6930.t1
MWIWSGRCKGSPTSTTHASVAQGSSTGSESRLYGRCALHWLQMHQTRTRLGYCRCHAVDGEEIKPADNSATQGCVQIKLGVHNCYSLTKAKHDNAYLEIGTNNLKPVLHYEMIDLA